MGIPKNYGKRDLHNPFTYMIEEVDEAGSIKRPVGGCDNVVGAQAMFEALPPYFGKHEFIRIRQGARIMTTVTGTDEERLKLIERMRR